MVQVAASAVVVVVAVAASVQAQDTEWVVSRKTTEGVWTSVASNGLAELIAVQIDSTNQRDQLMRSRDAGETWRELAAPEGDPSKWHVITHGRGDESRAAYVMVSEGPGSIGTNKIAYSEDSGDTWQLSTTFNSQNRWQDIAYADGVFVTVVNIKNTDAIAKSTNFGKNWFAEQTPFAGAGEWFSIAANHGASGNRMFVVVGDCRDRTTDSSCVMTQTYDKSIAGPWTLQTAPAARWRSIDFGNNYFIAVSNDPEEDAVRGMRSFDGITWEALITIADKPWIAIAFGSNVFVAVSSTGAVSRTFDDGMTFYDMNVPAQVATNYWTAVTVALNNVFVAVSLDGAPNQAMTYLAPLDPTAPTLPPTVPPGSGGGSTGGIVIVSVLFVLLAVSLVVYFSKEKKEREENGDTTSASVAPAPEEAPAERPPPPPPPPRRKKQREKIKYERV